MENEDEAMNDTSEVDKMSIVAPESERKEQK